MKTTLITRDKEMKNFTDVITPEQFEEMKLAYKNHNNKLKVFTNEGDKYLKGLKIELTDIARLVKNANDKGKTVSDIFIMFGAKEAEGSAEKYITTMVGAITHSDHQYGTLMLDLLYDYCDPCPNKCPRNYEHEL